MTACSFLRNCSAWFDGFGVVNAGASAGQQAQVPVHGVLVQGNQQIEVIAHVGDFFRAGANGEKGVAATDDGLVGVVDVQVQAATAEDFGENVAWRGNALTGRASYTNSEGLPHRFISQKAGRFDGAILIGTKHTPGFSRLATCGWHRGFRAVWQIVLIA